MTSSWQELSSTCNQSTVATILRCGLKNRGLSLTLRHMEFSIMLLLLPVKQAAQRFSTPRTCSTCSEGASALSQASQVKTSKQSKTSKPSQVRSWTQTLSGRRGGTGKHGFVLSCTRAQLGHLPQRCHYCYCSTSGIPSAHLRLILSSVGLVNCWAFRLCIF